MWQWLLQNSAALSLFISFATLCVWLFYAQLLYYSFSRQRQARLLITQGWGQQIDSVCLVANMSHEPIFIQHIMLTIKAGDGEYHSPVTDIDSAEPYDSANRPGEITRQGPLNSGQQINLGTFRSLIRQSAKLAGLTEDGEQPIKTLQLSNVRITVMASYGPGGDIIGAQRMFIVRGEDNELMRPVGIKTERFNKRRARRQMRKWLERQL